MAAAAAASKAQAAAVSLRSRSEESLLEPVGGSGPNSYKSDKLKLSFGSDRAKSGSPSSSFAANCNPISQKYGNLNSTSPRPQSSRVMATRYSCLNYPYSQYLMRWSCSVY